ncbi:MFS transporter [Nonomuraea sp. NPDC023979]|uniref:MFS transporter n=1 Tax=Nonomuraea sp. NPDC023979 TaxID=3154796 RepID=UPI0033D84EAD
MKATTPQASGRIRPRHSHARRPAGGLALLRLIAAAVTALVMGDSIATTLALPALADDPLTRAVPLTQLSWLTTVNFAATAALLVTGGRLADLLGRRAVLACGLALFGVGALAAAFAPLWPVLVAARLAQGVGAALMMPASLGLLLSRVSMAARAGALALWAGATSGGTLLVHGFGGLALTEYGWRVLYLPAGLLAIALLLLTAALPRSSASHRLMPDVLGVVALVSATTALVLLISQGGVWGWTAPPTLATLAVTAAGAAVAVTRSRRHPAGAVDLALWRRPGFGWGSLASLLYGVMAFPVLILAPLVLKELGFGLVEAGLALVPMSVAAIMVSPLAARLARRAGAWWPIYVGAYVSAAGFLMLIIDGDPALLSAIALILLGAGFGVINTAATIAGIGNVDKGQQAAAVGSIITARTLGGALGPAAAAALLAQSPGGPAVSYRGVLAGCIVVAIVVTGGAFILAMRQARLARTHAAAIGITAASGSTHVPQDTPAELVNLEDELARLQQVLLHQRDRLTAIARAAESELAALTAPVPPAPSRSIPALSRSSFPTPPGVQRGHGAHRAVPAAPAAAPAAAAARRVGPAPLTTLPGGQP